MGVQLDLKIIGIDLLKQKCQADTVKEPVNEGIKKLAKYTHQQLFYATPVDEGPLRASMTVKAYGDTAKIGTNKEYAQFVEYGTPSGTMEARHVTEGSATRILGIGPFQYTMQLLQKNIKDFLGEMGKAIEVRFG